MKCGWRSQGCITPKKGNPAILGNWQEKIQASGLDQTKICPKALGKTSSKVTSHPKGPQPRLIQLPLLPQDGSQVGHGGERVRVIRTEVRFAPCKSSAVQGLRLASWDDGVGGVGPQAWIRLWVLCDHVGKEEKWTMALCLDWWKRCQIQLCHVRCTHNSKLIQSLKNKTQRSMSWHVQQNLDVSHLRSNLPVVKKSKLRKQKNHRTIPGNKKNLQASSLGQTKKCPWWNVQESHLSPQRPQPATDPREPGGARLRSNAKWQERGCICKITSLVFIEFGWQHYPVGDFRSHAVPCWYSESWKFFRFDEPFWECDKGWLYFHEILPRVGTWSGGVGNKSQ